MNCILVYSTFPSKDHAERAARALLDEQLAAGANLFALDSLFRWQGTVERRAECAVLFQAERRFYKRIESRLKQLHPDKVPQIVMWRIKDGYPQFLAWIMDETVRPVGKRELKQRRRENRERSEKLQKPKSDRKG
jgi:periplasmic divalent cation tolerance protein